MAGQVDAVLVVAAYTARYTWSGILRSAEVGSRLSRYRCACVKFRGTVLGIE